MNRTLKALIPWYVLATVLVGTLAVSALFLAQSSTPTGFFGVTIAEPETSALGVSTFSVATDISACGNLTNVNNTLIANVSSPGLCFNFTVDNAFLDCNGFTITFDTAGTGASHGVLAINRKNITIKNCFIQDGSAGGSFGVAINFTSVNDSVILNNTIQTNGTNDNYGVLIKSDSSGNSIQSNTIQTKGSAGNNYGVHLSTTVSDTSILNNTVTTMGSSLNIGIRLTTSANNNSITNNTILTNGTSTNNLGILLTTTAHSNNITGNTIRTNGSSTNHGVQLTNANNSIISNNSITTDGAGAIGNKGITSTTAASGMTISGNVIVTGGASSGNYGIDLVTGDNNNDIRNNTLLTDGPGSSNQGIRIGNNGATGNNITGNYIQTNGTSSNYGIFAQLGAINNRIVNNTIFTAGNATNNYGIFLFSGSTGVSENVILGNTLSTSGSSENHGIRLETPSGSPPVANNSIIDNSISTSGGITSYGISIVNANGSQFNNTILTSVVQWINSTTSLNNFTNTTFRLSTGSIRFPQSFTVNGSRDINQTKLNITSNRAFLNAANLTFLNTSAFITLNGLNATGHGPTVDFEDDGTFTSCNASTCTEVTDSAGTYVMNVSHWTAFSTTETDVSCSNLSSSTTLTSNVSSGGLCFNLTADNILLDCDGFTITFDTAGTGAVAGIAATGRKNITIRDCTIIDNSSGGSFGVGINFTNTNNSLIFNNTIRTNGTSNNYGIFLFSSASNNTIAGNSITTRGTDSSNNGIFLSFSASNNVVENNSVTTNGTFNNAGIRLDNSANLNTVAKNNISANGNDSDNYGIELLVTVTNNNFTDNVLATRGTLNDHGIRVSTSSNNNAFRRNNITTAGNLSFAIIVIDSNGSQFNDTLLTYPVEWINVSVGTLSNFTNISFINGNGSLRFPGRIQLNGSIEVTRSLLNTSFNKVFLNSTSLSAFNTSAVVTLQNITFVDAKPLVDFEDDGTFVNCPADVCSEVSQNGGGMFVFNVSHFTTFASKENGSVNITLSKSESADPFNASPSGSMLLNYTINISVTNGTAYNITLSDLYPPQVVFNASAPSATGPLNNTFVIGNLSDGEFFTVNITVRVLSNVTNGTIINNTANITYANSTGTTFTLNVTENTTILNTTGACPGTISTSLTLANDLQAQIQETCVRIATSNIFLDCAGYSITGVGGTGLGVAIISASNVTVRNCEILGFFDGIQLNSTTGSRLTNNTIYNNTNYGIDLNFVDVGNVIDFNQLFNNSIGGVYIFFQSNNNSVAENNITENGFYGVHINRSTTNVVAQNNITNNSLTGIGIGVIAEITSSGTVVYNNSIFNHNTGVKFISDTDSGTIRNNTIINHSVAINITLSSGSSLIYGNWIYNDAVAHAHTDDSTNQFDNGGSPARGNFWQDIVNLSITDSDSNGYGDTGTDYPYTAANGAFVIGSVEDDGPIIINATPAAAPAPSGGGGGGGCSNECTLGTTACADASTSLICVTDYDSDSCTEYAPDPCAASEGCVAGSCVSCVSSWLCDEWSPCVAGVRERSCVDLNACAVPTGIPVMEEPCALLPIIELPSPLIPLTYGEMFAGTPVTCSRTIKASGADIGTRSTVIDISEVVPAGYALAAEPFSITCDGDSLEMTVTVSESFTDLRVLRCTGDTCVDAKTTGVSSLSHTCGSTTLGTETHKKILGSKSVLTPEELTAITSTRKALVPGDSVLMSGAYAFTTPAALSVRMSGLTFAISEPANPSLAIIGTPVVIDITDAPPGAIPASVTLPLTAPPGIDPSSIGIFALVGTAWMPLGGAQYPSTGVITADIADLQKYLVAGRVILATLGVECTACTDIKFEQAYRYPGARIAVIGVPGTFSDERTFEFLLADIEATRQPFDVWTFAYPATMTLDELGAAFADTLSTRMATYDGVYLVGHSAGGLILQQGLWVAHQRKDPVIGKVRRAILVGTPTGGSPAIGVVQNLFERLINQRTVAKAFNINSDLVQTAVTGREIGRVPGIDYQVIAGTRPYAFNVELFEGVKHDGLIATDSAQKVGQDLINDACNDYYEINLTHTELLDNDVGVRVIERVITSDMGESTPEQVLVGQNKYVTFAVTDCRPGDQYAVIGKTLRKEERYDPSGCACGNSWCGEGEDELSCPSDCATIFTVESFCVGNNVLALLLLIAVAVTALTFLIQHYLRKRQMSVRWLHAGAAASFVALVVIIVLVAVCGTYPWLLIVVLLILAAYHVAAILFERKHKHPQGYAQPPALPPMPPLPPHEHVEKDVHAPVPRAVTPEINRMVRHEAVETHDRIEQARKDLAAIDRQLKVLRSQLKQRRSNKR